MSELIKELYEKLTTINCCDKETLEIIDVINSKLKLAENIEKCLYDTELYLVYKHTDPNGKVYIGITQNHPQTRWNEGGGYEKQKRFYKAIQRYGWLNFKHEIIAAGLTKEEAASLENDLIISSKSYDEKYGYNTRVDLGFDNQVKEIEVQPIKKQHKKKLNVEKIEPKESVFTIAKLLVEKYAIKTIDDKIFYVKDSHYISEEKYPIIEFELVTNYQILTKDHKEIINQIKIITRTDVNTLTEEEKNDIIEREDEYKDDVLCWIIETSLDKKDFLSIPTTELYSMYVAWCKRQGRLTSIGKKRFFKFIQQKYQFSDKKQQKSDGKRYFIEQTNNKLF